MNTIWLSKKKKSAGRGYKTSDRISPLTDPNSFISASTGITAGDHMVMPVEPASITSSFPISWKIGGIAAFPNMGAKDCSQVPGTPDPF